MSCDTTQPPQGGSQTAAISVRATNATVTAFNVWDFFFDGRWEACDGPTPPAQCTTNPFCDFGPLTDMSGAGCASPDATLGCCIHDDVADDRDGDGTPEVFQLCLTDPSPQTASPASVPLDYSIRVTRIRADGTEEQLIGGTGSSFDSNQTLYDEVPPSGSTPLCPTAVVSDPITCSSGVLFFRNPRRLTAASRTVMASNNCPGFDAGEPMIGGLAQPFSFEVESGDTILVEARRGSTIPGGLSVTSEPTLAVETTLDGRGVEVLGTTSTGPEAGSPLSYSFTVR
ncbi:hypothetical protein ABI59_02780 [Acidobacteria bacterium Mor1]|nr:hypothetical protein ABI59_02780 [Acidobacteria bacterium Mor1]